MSFSHCFCFSSISFCISLAFLSLICRLLLHFSPCLIHLNYHSPLHICYLSLTQIFSSVTSLSRVFPSLLLFSDSIAYMYYLSFFSYTFIFPVLVFPPLLPYSFGHMNYFSLTCFSSLITFRSHFSPALLPFSSSIFFLLLHFTNALPFYYSFSLSGNFLLLIFHPLLSFSHTFVHIYYLSLSRLSTFKSQLCLLLPFPHSFVYMYYLFSHSFFALYYLFLSRFSSSINFLSLTCLISHYFICFLFLALCWPFCS